MTGYLSPVAPVAESVRLRIVAAHPVRCNDGYREGHTAGGRRRRRNLQPHLSRHKVRASARSGREWTQLERCGQLRARHAASRATSVLLDHCFQRLEKLRTTAGATAGGGQLQRRRTSAAWGDVGSTLTAHSALAGRLCLAALVGAARSDWSSYCFAASNRGDGSARSHRAVRPNLRTLRANMRTLRAT